MQSAQLTVYEVLSVFRRRRKPLLYPPILVTVLCVVGAYVLPRKYESSTTILVQRDEILNPLISFTMAVTLASEDRLRTFKEIIYSKTTINAVIDSLNLDKEIETEEERQELVNDIRKNIDTDRSGSDSFRITYSESDPVLAQRTVALLADLFIQTTLHVENKRNELAVKFFEEKLDEYGSKFDETQREMIMLTKKRIEDLPTESRSLSSRLDEIEEEIQTVKKRLAEYHEALGLLRSFPSSLANERSERMLERFQRGSLPYASELQSLVLRYDELTQRYTANYPEVRRTEMQILALVDRMRRGVESEIAKQTQLESQLVERRSSVIEEMKEHSTTDRLDESKESIYGIYRDLYDEMRIKLEQARTSRDLSKKAEQQFIIIDPPIVPHKPTKPDRVLIIFGGIGLGLLLGILSATTAELLDTTVRTARDVKVYHKPVIAYIADGRTDV